MITERGRRQSDVLGVNAYVADTLGIAGQPVRMFGKMVSTRATESTSIDVGPASFQTAFDDASNWLPASYAANGAVNGINASEIKAIASNRFTING